MLLVLQLVLKALLQDRKAAETPKQAKTAKFSFSVRAWARLKAFILLILLLYTIPGVTCEGHSWLTHGHFKYSNSGIEGGC